MTNLAIPNAAAAANAAAVAASTTAATPAGASSGSATSLTQANFLQLLTAQLKYQSPSNPANPTQMASEFAAISTVEGINALNAKLGALTGNAGASQVVQAASLVGKQVAVSGNMLVPGAAGTAAGAFSLSDSSANTTVTILRPDGSIADTINLGPLSAGQQNFNWHGGMAGMPYNYNLTALNNAGAPVSVTPYSVFTVQSVNVGGGKPTLNVAGSATPLPISSVQTILGATQ